MTRIDTYRHNKNPHKYIEVHNDGHYHNSVVQFILTVSGTRNKTGDRCLHRWRRDNLNELLEDYHIVTSGRQIGVR